ncbi:MAG TPA: ABC transporter transmembrane domain-containing protein [Pseudomonadales bacterium]|nr:ABC transporter transmembrane domain-containing protein [Pseudomonadales bacterium]
MTETQKKKLSTLLALVQFLKPYKGTIAAFLVALLFTSGVMLSIGQGVRLLIDRGFAQQSLEQLNWAIGFLLVIAVLMALGTFVRFYLVSWLGERVSADIRQAVFDHIVGLHPGFFEDNRSGDIMSRLTTDTTLLQSIIGSSFSMALRSAISVIGALILLFITNFKLSLIVLVCVPAVLLPILLLGKRVRTLSRQSQDSIADVGTYAGEIIQNIKTVQSYTREAQEKQAFGSEVERAFNVAKNRIRQRSVLMALVILLVFMALASMLWVGGSDVIQGRMTGGELGAFIVYAIMAAVGVATVSEVYGELLRAAGATDRLMELMHESSHIQPPAVVLCKADNLSAAFEFKDVSFSYPTRPEQRALDHFSLQIIEGKVLALVGPSGAGKSTVFEMLQRFYDPQQGAVTLGGKDIRELQPQDLRQQLAVVQQQPALFSADVMHNIRYGKPDATDEEVIAAAKAAYAHDFIIALPQGYQSDLGEKGARLSGGQRQRLAIARAILKNPRVLLLDEATSALDAESEYQVQLALEHLMKDRTTVIIAHRLATILHADSIAVMDGGRLVAQGSHNELLASNALYARLAQLQFGADAA